jgi:hypothetical protein
VTWETLNDPKFGASVRNTWHEVNWGRPFAEFAEFDAARARETRTTLPKLT